MRSCEEFMTAVDSGKNTTLLGYLSIAAKSNAENLNKEVKPEVKQEIKDIISDWAGIILNDSQVNLLLSLHPFTRIEICNEIEAGQHWLVVNMVSSYLLGCDYPSDDDDIDMDKYHKILTDQAQAIGWCVSAKLTN